MDVFRRAPPRGGCGRRAAVDFVVCFGWGGFFRVFFLDFFFFERTRPAASMRPQIPSQPKRRRLAVCCSQRNGCSGVDFVYIKRGQVTELDKGSEMTDTSDISRSSSIDIDGDFLCRIVVECSGDPKPSQRLTQTNNIALLCASAELCHTSSEFGWTVFGR